MYCQRCGNNNSEDSKFCQRCGAPMQQAAPVQQNYGQMQQNYNQVQYQYNYSVNNGMGAGNVIKELFSSKIFLVAVIAYSCAILFRLISSFTPSSSALLSTLYGLFEGNYEMQQILSEALTSYTSAVDTISVISGIFGALPEFLIIAALWLMFSAATNRTEYKMKTSGFTIIKVMNILRIVSIAFTGLILEVICLIAMIASSESYYMENLAPVFGVVMFAIAICVAVCIIVYAKVLKTMGVFSKTAQTGVAEKKASGFIAIWCVLVGIGQLISVVLTIFISFSFFGMLEALFMAVALIIFGIVLLRYNNSVESY